MAHLRVDKLRELLKSEGGRFDSVYAFRPSGWCLPRCGRSNGKTIRSGDVRVHEVPYSEHSSFTELVSCVRDLKPQKIVPTFNCNSAAKVKAIVNVLTAPPPDPGRGAVQVSKSNQTQICFSV